MSRAAFLTALVFAVVAAGAPAFTSAQNDRRRAVEFVGGRRAVAGEVLVRFRGDARAAVRDLDLSENERLLGGIHRLRARGASLGQLISALRSRPDVVYVEPNYVVTPAGLPDDPLFGSQLGFFNPQQPGRDAHAPEAWEITTGSRLGVVAILDTGADLSHPDLADNLWSAPAPFVVSIGGAQITCPAGTRGLDVIALTCDPSDDHGHGTAMAGIVGAVGNNAVGVAGMNWTARLLPVKFIGADGNGTYADAIRAIDVALQVDAAFATGTANRIRVLVASWSGTGESQALADAVERAAANDMLLVAAAGNDAMDIDAEPVYPASLPSPAVITVAATDGDDAKAPYSNYGIAADLAAPGATATTRAGGEYGVATGTSAAAAFVAGAASLALSRCALSTADLRRLLLETADVVPALAGVVDTSARLNAGQALRACAGVNAAPVVSVTAPAAQQTIDTVSGVTVAADAFDSDGSIVAVDFFAGAVWLGRDVTAPYALALPHWWAGVTRVTAAATDNEGATSMSSAVLVHGVEGAPVVQWPWNHADIGATGAVGWAAADASTVTVVAAGADIWGTNDAFGYVFQPLRGDGEIVARVALLERVEAWTKVGVMLRASLAPDAPHAFALVSSERGAAFQRRRGPGQATAHTAASAPGTHAWVRLTREGQTVTAALSADGANWDVIGADTVAWGDDIYAGVALTSHRAGVLASAVVDHVTLRTEHTAPAPAPANLPAGWSATDIGDVGLAGFSYADDGAFAMSGSGADIWGTSDAFHYTYTTLAGDGEIVARVAALQGGSGWTKAGVMLRRTLDPGSAHAFALVSGSQGVAFQRRPTDGSSTAHTGGGSAGAPVWLRLTRSGATASAYVSSDGVEWTLIGTDAVGDGGPLYAGLALTSHGRGQPAAAVFDSVHVAGPPVASVLALPWEGHDVGQVGTQGAHQQLGDGTLAVRGSGADVWGTNDAFHYTYVTLPGDGSFSARVLSVEAVHAWTKGGIMLRSSLAPDAAHAYLLLSGAQGIAFQRRPSSGGATHHTGGGMMSAPWLRLERRGPVITAMVSPDGVTWSILGEELVDFSGPVYAGLAVSSHETNRAATAVFAEVRVER